MDLVVHYSHSMEPFFCSGGGEFIVVIEVYGEWLKATETSAGGEFVGSGSCSNIGKFCERSPCLPTVLPIVTVDA